MLGRSVRIFAVFAVVFKSLMLQEERHQFILQQLAAHKKVHSEELSRQLGVSGDTVRRDLIALEKAGKLLRVHGGAIATDFHNPFQPEQVYAQKEKTVVARKALSLVKDGMTLLAGGGTVMLEFARLLPENLKGTLFTVSPLVALEAAQRSTIDVILLAGPLSRNNYICTGASVVRQLSDIRADLCLMGTHGFSITHGITDFDWESAQVKKAMLQSAARTAVLAIAEKKDVVHKIRVCALRDIDNLITELTPTSKQFTHYKNHCKML